MSTMRFDDPAALLNSPRQTGQMLWLALASCAFWLVATRFGSLGQLLGAALASVLGGIILLLIALGRLELAMLSLTYLVAIEPCVRRFAPRLGHLYLEYLVVACAVLALPARRGRPSLAIALFAIFFVLELSDIPRAGTTTQFRGVARALLLLGGMQLGLMLLGTRMDWTLNTTLAVLRAFLVGTLTLAGVVMVSIATGQVKWGTQANFEASGNMGPNQVGLILAFGAFVALVLSDFAVTAGERALYFSLICLQTLCSLMTFTRGGVLAFVVCTLVHMGPRIISRPKSAVGGIVILAAIAGAIWGAVSITDSMIIRRFEKKGVANRDVIVRGAWEIFLDNPVLGVGTGNFYAESAARQILRSGEETGTHNEPMRSLAEHGLVGFTIYVLFLVFSLGQALRGSGRARVTRALWWFLFLFSEVHSGLKMAVQPLLLVWACEAFRPAVGTGDPVRVDPIQWGARPSLP